jgi:hypothetical protein
VVKKAFISIFALGAMVASLSSVALEAIPDDEHSLLSMRLPIQMLRWGTMSLPA